MTPRRMQGFSLIELLVVIAVLGVLVGVVGISARGLLDRGRLAEATRLVDFRINEARLEAKRSDVEVEVILGVGGEALVRVGGRDYQLPNGTAFSSGVPLTLTFVPPFGIWEGSTESVAIRSGNSDATITFVGRLARRVVER